MWPSKTPPGPLFPSTIGITNLQQQKKKAPTALSYTTLYTQTSMKTHNWRRHLCVYKQTAGHRKSKLRQTQANVQKRVDINKDAQRAPTGLLQHGDRMSCNSPCSLCALRGRRKKFPGPSWCSGFLIRQVGGTVSDKRS